MREFGGFLPKRLGLCTTMYPSAMPFVRDWYASVLQQKESADELWIALDGLVETDVIRTIGSVPESAVWVHAEAGESPAAIRQRLLASAVENCDSLVLVDCDDILHPDRIHAARRGLRRSMILGCALRLIDRDGGDLGVVLGVPENGSPEDILPRNNLFGLSNTAWRSSLLRRCLPIPADIEIVDWYLAIRAWLLGAAISFDSAAHMAYRQHAANMVQVRGPFRSEQVVRDTERVCRHFRLVLSTPLEGAIDARKEKLIQVAHDIERFAARVTAYPQKLETYLAELNALDLPPLWWSCVAHPMLKQLWCG